MSFVPSRHRPQIEPGLSLGLVRDVPKHLRSRFPQLDHSTFEMPRGVENLTDGRLERLMAENAELRVTRRQSGESEMARRMEAMRRRSSPLAAQIAREETWHAVAAFALGMKVRNLLAIQREGNVIFVTGNAPPADVIAAVYSGVYAAGFSSVQSEGDKALLRKALSRVPESQHQSVLRAGQQKARALLSDPRRQAQAAHVADDLQEHGTITAERFQEIVSRY